MLELSSKARRGCNASRAHASPGRVAACGPALLACLLTALVAPLAPAAQRAGPPVASRAPPSAGPHVDDTDGPAVRPLYLDKTGVIRWRDSNAEVALYGANYCIMSGSDYRMAGLVSSDRKAMVDEDLAQFARLGWTALRLCSWGDWENADRAGNLIPNEHLDLLDYVIAKARERGIYLLLTPIHTYDPAFADQLGKPTPNRGSRATSRARKWAPTPARSPPRPTTSANC